VLNSWEVIETVVIVVIVVCFFAVTTGLRAYASKRSTGHWRYPGMLKYRSDRWEDRSTPWWTKSIDLTISGGPGPQSDPVDSDGGE
jgi:hypothetical protein